MPKTTKTAVVRPLRRCEQSFVHCSGAAGAAGAVFSYAARFSYLQATQRIPSTFVYTDFNVIQYLDIVLYLFCATVLLLCHFTYILNLV